MQPAAGPIVRLTAALLLIPAGAALGAGTMSRPWGRPVPVHSHEVEAVVAGGLAKTTVRQGFRSPWGRATEAVYEFPLPKGAALVGVAMEVGGRRYEGLLLDREKARRIYDRLTRRSVDPAIVEQIDDRFFRLSVFPVLPKSTTYVELTYVQALPVEDGALVYEYPLALPDETAARVKRDFSVTVRVESGEPLGEITASDPDAEVDRKNARTAVVSVAKTGVRLDRDFVARIPRPPVDAPRLRLATFREAEGDGWFLAAVDAPAAAEEDLPPMDATLLVDTSASMRGPKLAAAVACARRILAGFREHDTVRLLAFAEDVRPVDSDALGDLAADGHTDLGAALAAAMDPSASAPGRPSISILLTDGVTNRGEREMRPLVERVREAARPGHRLFVVPFGGDAETSTLARIAEAGGGTCFRAADDDRIPRRLRPPVLSALSVSAEGVTLHDVPPAPDLFGGGRVCLAGRYHGSGEATLTVTGRRAGKEVRVAGRATFRAEPGGVPLLPYFHARRMLDALDAPARWSKHDETTIVRLSLASGVQSWLTSFLVLLPEDRRRLVSNADEAAVKGALERMGKVRLASIGPDEFAAPVLIEPGGAPSPGGGLGGRVRPPNPWWRRSGDPLPEWMESRKRHRLRSSEPPGDAPREPTYGEERMIRAAIDGGLRWLSEHRDPQGFWDADGYARQCGESLCDGVGRADADVLVTGLALLAFLGERPRSWQWPGSDAARALHWLETVQDRDGAFGPPDAPDFLAGHAVATLAAVEFWALSGDKNWRKRAENAIAFLGHCESETFRKRHGIRASRPGLSPDPWAALALVTARAAEIRSTGLLSRVLPRLEPEPALIAETLLGKRPYVGEEMERRRAATLENLKMQEPDAARVFFASLALRQVGGEAWRTWAKAARDPLLLAQSEEGDEVGSWAPAGAWGEAGGRVAATALAVMSLQAYYRYDVRFPPPKERDDDGPRIR